MSPAQIALTTSLLLNGAFEQRIETGWEAAWSRTPNAVAVAIDDGALRVTHTGGKDWALSQANDIPVRPGEIWRISGRTRITRIDGSLQLGVTLRDARGEVVDWVFGAAETRAAHDWQATESKFLVPPGATTMRFRITGDGPCAGWLDDLALTRTADPPVPGSVVPVELFSSTLHLTLTADGTLIVSGAGAGTRWRQVAAPGGLLSLTRAERVTARSLRLSLADRLADLIVTATVELHPTEPEISIRLSANADAAPSGVLRWPTPFVSRATDLLFLPYAEGIVVPAAEIRKGWGFAWFAWKSGFDYSDWKTSMGFAAVSGPDGSGYSLHLETPWDASIETPVVAGHGAIGIAWKPSKGRFGYDRRMIMRFTRTGGHVGLAMRHRDLMIAQGWHRTLADKAKNRPAVRKLPGAINLWMLDRGLPPDFLDDLKASGVTRAVVSVGGGWKEPEDADPLIRKIQSLGYLGSRYDIYTDAWNPADHPPPWQRTAGYPDDVIVDADGSRHKGWLDKTDRGNFQGYYLCALTHRKTAAERIGIEVRRTPYAARFIDVVTAAGLFECFAPLHLASRHEDALARTDMLKLVGDEFHLVTGTEEIREWAVPFSDWSEGTMTIKPAENAGYDWGAPVEGDPEYVALTASAAHRVPLFELVFHDCHQSSWYTGDGMTKVPSAWDAKDLLNLLYGTMPLWMPDAKIWKAHRNRFLYSYFTVNAIGEVLGDSRMINHEFLTADRQVQRTTFSSGHTITANFGKGNYSLVGPVGGPVILPPFGFLAHGPGLDARRSREGALTVTRVVTATRTFLDPPNPR